MKELAIARICQINGGKVLIPMPKVKNDIIYRLRFTRRKLLERYDKK